MRYVCRGDPNVPVIPSDNNNPVLGLYTVAQTDIIAVQRKYYYQNWSFGYQWLLVMSTQLIGFSLGGAAKRFLVSPPSMSLSTCLLTSSYRALMMGCLSLACEPCHMCTFQHPSLSGLPGFSRHGNESRTFLFLCVPCLLYLV